MALTSHLTLARQLADHFQQFPQVQAIALGGSQTSGALTDPTSDIDLYIYTTEKIPLPQRIAIVEAMGGASQANMNIDLWDPGDEWYHAPTGIEVDAVYWEPRWIEGMLDRVIHEHQASMGYSTAHWHTIYNSQVLFDRGGWFSRLQEMSRTPYPEPLRRNIINKNFPILRDLIPSYLHQVEKAVRRKDLVSVNHRVADLFDSYFDVIFAHNRVLHPGEKRLLEHAARLCPELPENMAEQVTTVLTLAGTTDPQLVKEINVFVDGLENIIQER